MEENLKTIFNSLYYINQNGVVFDSDLKIMKQQMTFDGYPVISLRMNDGSRKTHRVHRLVAVAFIENPELKKEVNHKDGIKTNNNVNNLEWATHSENIKHAWDNKLIKNTEKRIHKLRTKCSNHGSKNGKSRKVQGINSSGEKTRIYDTLTEAAKSFETSGSQISASVNKKLTKCGRVRFAGFLNEQPITWSFVE